MHSDPVEELVQQLHGAFADHLPITWQIEIYATGNIVKTIPYVQARWRPDLDLLEALDRALREPGEERVLVLEVALDGQTAEFSYTFDLESVGPTQAVVDPDYRYPNHPRGGTQPLAVTLPTDQATDPDVLRHTEFLVTEICDLHQQRTGRQPEFGESCSEQQIVAAERQLGVRLPEDVRALYRLIGADPNEMGLLGGYCLSSLSTVVSDHRLMDSSADGALFSIADRVVFETHPPATVRRVLDSDRWIPIASDFARNNCVVDLDPASGGRYGQLLESGRDFHGPPAFFADSVTAVLSETLGTLLRGEVGDPDWGGDGIGVRLDHRSTVDHRQVVSVGGLDLAAALSEVPGIEHVQDLSLQDMGRTAHRLPWGIKTYYFSGGSPFVRDETDVLDLRALSAIPSLRQVSVNWVGPVRLWFPDTVEAVDLDVAQADLSVLAGHPALWDLTVAGFDVRVEDLAALPALARLDASGAHIDDVDALADLDVRVLVLNNEQWAQLQATDRLPKRLAGAQLTGQQTIAEAGEWYSWVWSTVGR
ncbi:SMI1/KNR4 family protein [Nocardia sp. NPDC051463]|uniref:SMI1/KNR4 family protein n=1 Tax=Nocardia sp. NPDC051463 TaxID=3154845 RepID=UPI00344AA1C1